MLDWETLNVDFNPVLIQVGCTLAAPTENGKLEIVDKYSANININSQIPLGRSISMATLDWWSKQEPAVYNQVFSGPGSEIHIVLVQLHNFLVRVLSQKKPAYLWANGSLADTFWLKHLYKNLSDKGVTNLVYPVNYNQEKCFRTMIFGLKDFIYRRYQNTAKHNALEDAIWQTNILLDFINNYDAVIADMDEFYKLKGN